MRTAPKIDIYYFSGTGNTAWVVHRLAERLTGLGDEVTIASCEQVAASEVDPAACDVMGIAFPVHASFAPPIFRDFLRDLPPDNGKPLFAVTTAGYAAGDTAWYAVRPLREKGYEPFLMDNVLMGNNLYMPGLPALFPSPEKMVPRLGKAKQKIGALADLIHRHERHVKGASPSGRLLGIIQRATFDWFPFKFYVQDNCTRCGWCVRHCPTHNIEMTDEGIEFRDRCTQCMRCFNFCPVQAIQMPGATKSGKRRRYRGPEGEPYPTKHSM